MQTYTHSHKTYKKHRNQEPSRKKRQQIWAIFTYIGREIKTITKLFKDANINIAYKTHNTIEHILRPKLSTTDNIYNNSGIFYQLNCLECPKKYIGRTGRTFKTRYKEHIHAIRNNPPDTGYSRHLLNTGHTYGNIDNTMTIIRKARKEKFLNSLEKYYVFLASKQEIYMNEFDVDHNDPIYETMYQKLKKYSHK
jgi:predicted transcriptional regulator